MNLFRKKSTLADLITTDYNDIHSHVLPGIDDGAKTVEDTKLLLSQLKELGFAKLNATPHIMGGTWDNNVETIFESFSYAKENLPNDLRPMLNSFSAEYMVDYEFLKKIKSEKLLIIGKNYVLIEFSFMEAPKIIFDVINELQMEGYEIILAHPERYAYYHKHFYLYEELKSYNIKFQMNLLSSVGYYGNKIMQTADSLLENGFIDFTGSDVHHQGHIDSFQKKVKIKNIKAFQQAMENNKSLLQEGGVLKKTMAK